jgi:hypothetical protein
LRLHVAAQQQPFAILEGLQLFVGEPCSLPA